MALASMNRALAESNSKKDKELNNNFSNKSCSGGTAHRIIRCGLLAAVTLTVSGIASAQDRDQDKKDEMTFSLPQNTTVSTVSTTLTPEQGNSEFLAAHAVGTQGYVCLP